MSNIIGIDLGTCFSVLAVIDETGRPQVVRGGDGSNLLPSCVKIDPVTMVAEVGENARKEWGVSLSSNVAARFKRTIGTPKKYSLANREYSPEELSAFVLKKLVKEAENIVGPITKAVITVPANFANEAREATMTAAKMAGLEVEYIINEPTAAALYYAFKNGEEFHGNYAVYDLGGGTFDISIIKVDGQQIDVLASNGIQKLGGDDFDDALFSLVGKKYKDMTGEKMDTLDYDKDSAESNKKSLSSGKSVLMRINRKLIEITREEFEESISSKIAQAEMLCEATLEEAGLRIDEITKVLLAGGSTRMPIVVESIERVFNQKPINAINVDEVVSLGAALYAAYKADRNTLTPTQRIAVEKINIQDVAGMNYGTLILDGNSSLKDHMMINDILIQKNANIPCDVTRSYYTVNANQTAVDCDVTECAMFETDPRFVKVIWRDELALPAGRPPGQEVVVVFRYDSNQIMHCKFTDKDTGREKEVSLSMLTKNASSTGINDFTVE